jgi:hypothetical protein
VGGNASARTAAIVAAAATGWLAGLVFAWGGIDFVLDDAWIHLSYALSMKLGEGVSYNPNDWETGFSSPLWVLALAILPWLGNPVLAAKALGVFLHGVAAGLAALCTAVLVERHSGAVEPPGRPSLAALFAGLLVALHPGLLQAAVSGMEVSLTVVLLLALIWSVVQPLDDRAALLRAGFIACACVLARPESLYFAGALGVVFAMQRRNLWSLAPAVGAAAGMGLWMLYCLMVSGYPLPSSHYIKSSVAGLPSIQYLAVDVLLSEPWVVSIAGIVLLLLSLRFERKGQERIMTGLVFAWLAALVATALSREVSTGVLFFHWRYFSIFVAVPLVVLATSLALGPRRWVYGGAVIVLLATAAFLPSRHALVRAQERGIYALHTEPARVAARELPADTVLLVEGAGAMRFFAPRTMWIIDAVGLNDSIIAHAEDSFGRICHIYGLEPAYFFLPDEYMGGLAPAFRYEVIREFHDPAFAQTTSFVPRSAWLCEIDSYQPAIQARCP